MTLKNKFCMACKKTLTTKNVRRIGRQPLGNSDVLYFNCKGCESTFILLMPLNIQLTKAAV